MTGIFNDSTADPGYQETGFTIADFTEHKYYKGFYELALREIYAEPITITKT